MTETHAVAVAPIDEAIDHVRGPATAPHVILEYGDYECPYSRAAYRELSGVERALGDQVRVAYRHFPITEMHPRALPASAAAEAAHLQGRFWEMNDLLFRRQPVLADKYLRAYAETIGLDVARFDADRASAAVLSRIDRDVKSALATGQVHGTPTFFIDGRLYRGDYTAAVLVEILTGD